jgi:hypothetical protein
MRSISVDHSVSISTVSKIAAELGLSSPRKRSKPVQPPDHSYDKGRRIAVLDMMLKGIEDQIRAGGLNSKQLFDLARSARELTTSRRGEDQLPDALDSEAALASRAGRLPGKEEDYDALVELYSDRTPKNIQVLFAVHDLEEAQLAGDTEAEEAAKERIRTGCRRAGLSDVDVPYSRMIQVADREHNEKFPLDKYPVLPREALADYDGKGLS